MVTTWEFFRIQNHCVENLRDEASNAAASPTNFSLTPSRIQGLSSPDTPARSRYQRVPAQQRSCAYYYFYYTRKMDERWPLWWSIWGKCLDTKPVSRILLVPRNQRFLNSHWRPQYFRRGFKGLIKIATAAFIATYKQIGTSWKAISTVAASPQILEEPPQATQQLPRGSPRRKEFGPRQDSFDAS